MLIYKHEGHRRTLTIEQSVLATRHIRFSIDGISTTVPDDDIPAIISGLQNYMSRKARELSRAARQ